MATQLRLLRYLQVPAIALALLLICVHARDVVSSTVSSIGYLPGDCIFYRAVGYSILEDGDLSIENNLEPASLMNNVAVSSSGELVPKHSLLLPFLSLPFLFFFGDPGLLIFNLLQYILIGIVMYKLNSLFARQEIAAITSAIFLFFTQLLNYSANYSPDLLSTLIVTSGIYLWHRQRSAFGMFLLGLSVFAKVYNIIPLAVVLAYHIFIDVRGESAFKSVKGSKGICRICGIAPFFSLAAGLFPLLFFNRWLFGSIWGNGYNATAIGQDLNGNWLTSDHLSKFDQPLLTGIWNNLFNPTFGLIASNPVLLIALAGIPYLMFDRGPRARFGTLLVLVSIGLLLFFAKYNEWYTSSFGNRFLMTPLVLISIFFSIFTERLTTILRPLLGYLSRD